MPDTPVAGTPSTIKRALLAVERLQARLDAVERARTEPIAIVGLACRLPGGVDSPASYWRLLSSGIDAITEVPASRWDAARFYDPDPAARGKTYSRHGGFLADVDRFDPWFFRISPREAHILDPQQRLLLEAAWEAIEDAGIAADRLGGEPVGVFVGLTTNDYAQVMLRARGADLDAHFFTGNPPNTAAGRLAYTFGFRGPAMAIDTACSSSLVAVHQACLSLRAGECRAALAGGVNLILAPENSVAVAKTRALAADGRCRTFDRAASGFVRSEGCGLVLLKRLSDALADGDRIRAVVLGSAVNQDGASSGFTVPNGHAQQDVIRGALGALPPETIDYLEAHGTATPLGDPIEVHAAAAVLGAGRDAASPLYIGSVKTNIGHCEAAAGVAGLIKTVLALEHAEIPPHLHFEEPSPHIDWTLPVRVPVTPTPWPAHDRARRAGVSAFGASGTNAHVVLEEAPRAATAHPPAVHRDRHLLLLSAKTPAARAALARRYADQLAADPHADLAAICATAAGGRVHHRHRVGVVASSVEEMRQQLEAAAAAPVPEAEESAPRAPRIAFLFTGQGSQYRGMGRTLYETDETFRAAIDRCGAILAGRFEPPLQDVLFGDGPWLDDTRYAQPAIFSLQYALVELFRAWGVVPEAVIGHSVGEFAAACTAGVFGLEAGLTLIAERARLMSAQPREGAMAAVRADAARVRAAMQPFAADVSIAALNGPLNTVISGTREAVAAVQAQLSGEGIRSAPLAVSHAFHSRLMDPILDAFERAAAVTPAAPPVIAFVSNVTGEAVTAAPDAAYWRAHCREAVRFADGIETVAALGCDTLVEIGPGPVLVRLAAQCRGGEQAVRLASLAPGERDWQVLLETMGALYARGASLAWDEAGGRVRRRAALPTYPFQRTRYWVSEIEPSMDQTSQPSAHARETARRERVLATLRRYIAELLRAPESQVDTGLPFLEMGADSLVMVEAIGVIEKEYGLKLAIRRFFEDLSTLDALADFIDAALPAEPAAGAAAAPVATVAAALPTPIAGGGALVEVLAEQNRIMAQFVAQQGELIRAALGGTSAVGLSPVATTPARPASVPPLAPPPAAGSPSSGKVMPWGNAADLRARGLTEKQRAHLESLIERYTARTRLSKARTQDVRRVLADSRASVGFRLSTKEMLYPISGTRGEGSRLWDVDGNEYIDYTMGFGVHLFGHRPPFVQAAVREELERSLELGMRAEAVGEVATLMTKLTGLERVAFCNSGTEAVMAAVRLARARTLRDTIAIFTNSYHGHADTTLARAQAVDGAAVSVPMMPGVPARLAADVLVLDYGSDEALETLRRRGHELAAVLVEPVQSRHVTLQPREFLHEVRQITRECGAALIFDEMITGFRAHLGGAQAHFGVTADLATYGKIVGGGLPIGLVAGSADFMDGIDGGAWQYGDASYPAADRTAFGGTFCQHPLSMAAARAVLRHLDAEGPELQRRLNDRTAALVRSLNDFFRAGDVPIEATHFSSLFRFEFSSNLDLLFYHLLEKGIYIWEWRSCFLSTAHSDEDIARFADAVQETVDDLRRGGFLPAAPRRTATGGRRLPLSDAQRQMALLLQIDQTGSIAYNINTTLDLSGPLDLGRLEAALQHVVDRHAALRTTISADWREQHVHDAVRVRLPVTDLSEGPEAEREAALARWRADESRQPIDLVRGPVIRAQVARMGRERHVLSLTVHHMLADGTSMGVVLGEMSAFYNELGRGDVTPRPPAMQFDEYVATTERRHQSPEMQAHEAFWRTTFADGVPPLNLPLDRVRPPMKTYAGSRLTRVLTGDLVAAVKRTAREHGCSLHMTLMAAFALLLHRYCRQDDLVVGTSVSGRPFPGSAGVVGYCTHLVPVRSRLSASSSFSDLLKATRQVLLDVADHQDFTFADLLRALDVPRTAGNFPIVSAVFNLEPVSTLPQIQGVTAALLPQVVSFTPFDLFVNVFDGGDRLTIDADFNTDLFDPDTVARMLDSFTTLLDAGVHAPRTETGRLPLLSDVEQQRLLTDFNRTTVEYPDLDFAHVAIEAHATERPDAVAVSLEGRTLSYGELNARANRLAHYLRTRGVGPDVVVAICCERSLDMMPAVLAVLKAGGAYLPIDAEYPRERIEFMLADSGARFVLTQGRIAGTLGSSAAEVFRLDDDWTRVERLPEDNPPHVTEGSHAAFVIYTSGSTGRPKGSLNTHRALANLLCWTRNEYRLTADDRVLNKTSFSFDVCVWEQLSALSCGARLVMARPGGQRDSRYLADLVEQERITFLHFVPSMLRVFVDEPGVASRSRSLRCVVSAGEPLPNELARRFVASFGAELHNSYGPSECAVGITGYPYVGPEPSAVVPLGRPLTNTQIYILDERLQPVPVGVAGELHVAGAQVGNGYLNRPELTAERFIPNPFPGGAALYRTGDLARFRADGVIEFLGRLDHQVKVRGFRIELGEVQQVLLECPGVSAAVVVAEHGPAGDQRLVAYVSAAPGVEVTAGALKERLRATLPDYMVPAAIGVMDALPIGPNGKLDRSRLPALFVETYVAPDGDAETALASIWEELLGHTPVGATDDFFALGGHSLSANELVIRANRQLRAGIDIRDVFTCSTVRSLARRIRDGRVPELPSLVPVARQSSYELSHAQRRFWIQDRLGDASTGNAHPVSLRIDGPLDAATFRQTLQAIVARHEILRTVFVEEAGQPRQQVLDADACHVDLRETDISTAADADAALRTIERAHVSTRFDLSRWPLFAVELVRCAPDRHVCVCNMHHIVTDGWSVNVLLDEVAAVYDAFAAGEATPLEPLRIQYVDFAAWQNGLLADRGAASMRTYWQQKLAGGVQRLRLPTDVPRRQAGPYRRASHRFSIAGGDVETLAAAARAQGATLFMSLLAAIKVLLFRHTAQEDICVGTPVAGRVDAELVRQIGPYLNVLPMRDAVAGEDTFATVLYEVRQTVVDGFANQLYPLDRMIEDLHLAREAGRNPLFDVGFTLQNQGEALRPRRSARLGIDVLQREAAFVEHDEATTDLWFLLRALDDGSMSGEVVYNGSLFAPATVEALTRDLHAIVAAAGANPDLTVSGVPLAGGSAPRTAQKITINLGL